MKRFIVLCAMFVMFVGCKPALLDVFVEIAPNQTAYVVPLEGDTEGNQGKFDSADFLDKMKVAAKRIRIAQTEKKVGRFSWQIEWVPSVLVVTVDRSPVTREWVNAEDKGTSSKYEGIEVESRDSVGFDVGINITTMIKEENTSKFLYTYAGKTLEEIIDTNIRGAVQSSLANAFGSLSLTECKIQKSAIIQAAGVEITEKFVEFGITVISFGNTGGLVYTNPDIQTAIDAAYQAEMDVQVAAQEKLAQDERNEMMVAKVVAEREAAEEFQLAEAARAKQIDLDVRLMQAEAALAMAKNWNGALPANILPADSPLLLGLNTANNVAPASPVLPPAPFQP